MNKPTPDQISKLPRWAQEHIATLERERFVSVRALNEYQDSQTESPFRYWDYIPTGETSGPTQKTRFIQTNKIEAHWAGVELTILLRHGSDEIDMHWGAQNRAISEVAMIPYSFGSVRLKSKESMR